MNKVIYVNCILPRIIAVSWKWTSALSRMEVSYDIQVKTSLTLIKVFRLPLFL